MAADPSTDRFGLAEMATKNDQQKENNMTVLQGVRVNLDGTAEGVKIIATTSGERLSAMYKLIGCALVEPVDLPEGITLWVDEEGLYRSEHNPTLTAMVHRTRPAQSPLFGVGLFLGFEDATGETVGLTRDQLASVIGWWRCATLGGNNPDAVRPRLALA